MLLGQFSLIRNCFRNILDLGLESCYGQTTSQELDRLSKHCQLLPQEMGLH